MSWLDKFQNSRFGRPFRKRQKLGEDEDDWCDALSNLHVDSSSSDEYVDASEQVPVNSSPKGIKRRKTKNKNRNKKQKRSKIFGDSSSSSSTTDTSTVTGRTSEINPAQPLEEQIASNWFQVPANKAQRKKGLKKHIRSDMRGPAAQPAVMSASKEKERGFSDQGSQQRPKSTGYPFSRDHKEYLGSGNKVGFSANIIRTSLSMDQQMDTQVPSASSTTSTDPSVSATSASYLVTDRKKGAQSWCGHEGLTSYKPSSHQQIVTRLDKHDKDGRFENRLDRLEQTLHHKDSHRPMEEQSGNRPGTRSVSQASKEQVVKSQTDKDSHRPMEEQSGNRPGTRSVIQSSKQQVVAKSQTDKDSHHSIETQSGNRPGTRSVSLASKQQVVAKTETDKDLHHSIETRSGNRPGTRSVSLASKQQYVVKIQTYSHRPMEEQSGNRPGTRSVSQASKQQVVTKSQTDKDLHHSIETQSGNKPGTRSVSQASKQQFVAKTQTDSHRPMEEQSGHRPGTSSVSQVSTQQIYKNTHWDKDEPMDTQSGNREGSSCIKKASEESIFTKTKTDKGHGELTQYGHVAPICQNRKVNVTLMTSSQMYTIDGLTKKLKTFKKSRPDLIDAVKVLQLPYSRIQYYEFTEDVDIMILCHSIENRRFAITNVTDSLYDEFLDYCYKTLGKEKIVVVAHDFPPEANEVRDVKMDSFKHTQWTTFEKAGLVMICGMMDRKPEMQEEDWDSLVRFLEAASKSTPIRHDTNPSQAGKKWGRVESSKSKTSNPGTTKLASINVGKSLKALVPSSPFGSKKPSSRKPIIYICTSWGFSSVKGLQVKLQTLIKRSYSEYEVKEKELPYNRLQDFRFPKEVDEHDAMILCHSVQNRGFSITDVPNSIYDEYLQHCNKVFGKYHLAVIVHDFEYTDEILRIHMDTFRRTQPKTFQFAGFVALARKLDVADVQLPHDDLIQLQKFVKNL